MQNMTFEHYQRAVINKAREIYPHSICVDNVRDFYNRGESIEECAVDAAFTSCLWDYGFECLTFGMSTKEVNSGKLY